MPTHQAFCKSCTILGSEAAVIRRIALLAVLIVLAGCSSSRSSGLPDRSHDASTLAWGIIGLSDVPTLDPALASDPTSITVSSLVYGGLVRMDGRLRVVPDGASHWSISRDGRTYTFTLRPNLRFPDGRLVTAADFAAAISRALGPEGSAGPAGFYLGLINHQPAAGEAAGRSGPGVVAVNPSTLRITLAHPAAHFLSELAFPASFVPNLRTVATYGESWTDHASGFGPYYVQEWRHSRYLKLVANPHYFGGRLPIRAITIRFYANHTALAGYSKGDLDVVSGLQAGDTLGGAFTGLRRVPGLALDYVAFNTQALPFHHLNARRAFAAIDVAPLAKRAMGASAFPATGMLPSGFGLPVVALPPHTSPGSLLTRAGYPDGQGFPRLDLVLPRDPHVAALAAALRDAWYRALGTPVQLDQLNESNYSKILNAHAFTIAIVRWGADYADPQDFLGTQLGSSSENLTGWTSPHYDTAVALADSYNPSDPRRQGLFLQAAQLAARHVPILPLDQPTQTALVRPDLDGLALTPLGTLFGDWRAIHFR